MTKEEFLDIANFSRYPKYTLSQVREGNPNKDTIAIAVITSGSLLIGKYEGGKWSQAHVTSTIYGDKQEIYYEEIEEEILYWVEGDGEDYSKGN